MFNSLRSAGCCWPDAAVAQKTAIAIGQMAFIGRLKTVFQLLTNLSALLLSNYLDNGRGAVHFGTGSYELPESYRFEMWTEMPTEVQRLPGRPNGQCLIKNSGASNA